MRFFSLLFVSRVLLLAVLAAWAAFIAVWAYCIGDVVAGWWFLANPVNLCFFLGVGLFYATRKGVSDRVAVACALFGAITVVTQAGLEIPNRWLLAAGFGSLIIVAQSGVAQRLSPGRWFLFMGAASYSIYLIHNPALSVLARIIRRWFPGLSPGLAFMIMGTCAVAAALAYYVVYERPTLAMARKKVSGYLKQRLAGELAAR